MSFNMDKYKKCQQCIHLQEEFYMELECGEKLYNYYCDYDTSTREIECDKFEEKENKVISELVVSILGK